MLSKYLEHRFKQSPESLKALKVLEVGAGHGLVGVVAAVLGCDVVTTDLGEYLDLLKRNAEKNAEHYRGSIRVEELRWGAPTNIEKPQMIIASECIYFLNLIEPLLRFVQQSHWRVHTDSKHTQTCVNCCSTLLRLSDRNTEILLSFEHHNPENTEAFLQRARELFALEYIPEAELPLAYRTDIIKLLRLKRQ